MAMQGVARAGDPGAFGDGLAGDSGDVAPSGWRWITLLSMTNFCSFFERIILSFMFVPLQQDLHLTDTQVGLIAGPAFALPYLLATLPLGYLVDRSNRHLLLTAALLLWSVMTVACGLAAGLVTLIGFRAGVGLSEAVVMPCTSSIVGDLFGPRSRPVAFGVFFMSGASAILLSFLIGGGVTYWLTRYSTVIVPLIGPLTSWRVMLLASGGLGLALVPFLSFAVREPERGSRDHPRSGGSGGLLRFLRQNPHLSFAVVVGVPIANAGALTFLNWMTIFFSRVHGWSTSRAGLVFALTAGLAAFAGSFAIGKLPGLLRRRGLPGATLLACLILGVSMLPPE